MFRTRRRNLLNKMYNETYPCSDQVQGAFDAIAFARLFEVIPRGQLVEYLTASEREWQTYKRAYGYIEFLRNVSIGAIFNLLKGKYFSDTKQYFPNYSLKNWFFKDMLHRCCNKFQWRKCLKITLAASAAHFGKMRLIIWEYN